MIEQRERPSDSCTRVESTDLPEPEGPAMPMMMGLFNVSTESSERVVLHFAR